MQAAPAAAAPKSQKAGQELGPQSGPISCFRNAVPYRTPNFELLHIISRLAHATKLTGVAVLTHAPKLTDVTKLTHRLLDSHTSY